MAAPSSPRPPAVVRHPLRTALAVWAAVACVLAAQTQLQLRLSGHARPFLPLLGVALVGCGVWVLYTPGLAWLARRARDLRRRRGWPAGLALHAVVGGALAVVDAALWATVAPAFGAFGGQPMWGPRFASSLLLNAFFYVGIVLFVDAADHAALSDARAREAASLAERAAALQAQLDAARVRALEAQLRPHFLHNTLNVIAELVHEAPERADAMLAQLGRLLRRGLGDGAPGEGGAHLVPLGEEVSFVCAYGALLAERFGDRVRLAVAVPDAAAGLLVPAYALQPLVENAFEHGARRREGATAVSVTAVVDAGVLRLAVRDAPADDGADAGADCASDERLGAPPNTAPPVRPGAGTRTGTGVGLRNTRERLAALYGSAAGLTLARDGRATVAILWLPAQPADAARPLST